MNLTDGLEFLTDNDRMLVIHGVLKSLGISSSRDDYYDLVQEATLIFAQAYCDYPKDQTDPANERDLMTFAFQRIRWRLLDLLRHRQRMKSLTGATLDNPTSEDDYADYLADPRARQGFGHLENSAFFSALFDRCNHKQQRYLIAKLKYDYTDQEISRIYGVSRQAVYQWKQGVIVQAKRLRGK